MQQTNTFLRLWDYCWEYVIQLRIITAHDHIYGESSTPFQQIYGYTPDISELLQFQWFDWVHYHEPTNPNKNYWVADLDQHTQLDRAWHIMF